MCRKNNMHFARLGLIVGKRAVRNAAERNRIKRVVRDHFRHCQHELAEFDVVVQLMGEVDNTKLQQLLVEALGLIGKEIHEKSSARDVLER